MKLRVQQLFHKINAGTRVP